MTPVRPVAVLVALALGFVPALAHAQADPAQVCGATLERARSANENGKLRLAREGYAACARETCPTELRADCAKKRDEVEQALPTTSFVVSDERGRDLDAKVIIDDGSIPVTLGRATPLDPGVHDVTLLLPDGTRGFRKITIVEGQKRRLVTLAPEPKTAPAQAPSAAHLPSPSGDRLDGSLAVALGDDGSSGGAVRGREPARDPRPDGRTASGRIG